jgi:hypothetical protein
VSIVFVSGFQRCGSSLMMQMLQAGGCPVFYDPGMGFPAFETMRQIHQADDPSWLLPLNGHAVKWLEPRRQMPAGIPYDIQVIWMTREHREQAKSAVKFLSRVGGLNVPSNAWRGFAKSYGKDEPGAIALWRARGAVLVQRFEDVLGDPGACARRVSTFLGQPLCVDRMVAAVVPRDARCLPGLLELELLSRGEART